MGVAVPEESAALKHALGQDAEAVDVQLHLPRSVAEQVLKVLEAQDSGGALVVPVKAEYTTTEAAQLLGMSRPTLMRFIKRGRLGFRMVGQHHRKRAMSLRASASDSRPSRRLRPGTSRRSQTATITSDAIGRPH